MAREVDSEAAEESLPNNETCATVVGEKHEREASDESFLPGLPDDAALDVLAWNSRSGYGALACLNKKFASLIGSGYLYALRQKLGIVEHWVYLSCQVMQWEAFDPESQRWTKLPRVPGDQCFTWSDKESLAVGTELLVFGRELREYAIWRYSLLTREWSRSAPMSRPRCLFGSSSLGEIGIVAGGTDCSGESIKSAELYNSRLGTWQALPDLNVARKLCSGFAMDSKFYVIGGMSSRTSGLTCGEEYDMETNKWRRIENMYPVAVAVTGTGTGTGTGTSNSPPLVAVVKNELYWADLAGKEVKKYGKENKRWSVVKRLPECANNSVGGWGIGFRGCGRRLLVICGHSQEVMMHSWEPDTDADADWNVLSVMQNSGAFVYNCAIMGC